MRRGRFTEDQIIGVLREDEAGVKTAELCRKHGISDATFYNWKAKYGGMTVSEAARLRTLEDENRRLKKLLRREGKGMNLKKVYRLYREERLTVRKRGGRKRALGTRVPMAIPQEPNQRWSVDFVSDSLACGRRFRMHGRHRRLQPGMPGMHRRHLAVGWTGCSRAEHHRRASRAAVHGGKR